MSQIPRFRKVITLKLLVYEWEAYITHSHFYIDNAVWPVKLMLYYLRKWQCL